MSPFGQMSANRPSITDSSTKPYCKQMESLKRSFFLLFAFRFLAVFHEVFLIRFRGH